MRVVKQGLFCPACSAFDVWTDEDDAGDYYAGTAFYCLTCHTGLPDLGSVRRASVISVATLDAYTLQKYIEIRNRANRDADGKVVADGFEAVTAQFRELHAKAVAEQEKRRKAYEPMLRASRCSRC